MICEFNKEKLHNILKNWHLTLKVTISVWDSDFNQLIFYPKPMVSICEKIKSHSDGNRKCTRSDIDACVKAADLKDTYSFICHAGLVDAVIPVYYKNELVAYILFGQVRSSDNKETKVLDNKYCKKYDMDYNTISKDYDSLPSLSTEQIVSTGNVIKMCIPYLFECEAIKPKTNELAAAIESYISQNITSPLTTKQLCEQFNISINALYQISHKYFNTSIKDFVIQTRIEKAKHFLANTALSVSEISSIVGFTNYNFFIRMFRARTGYTPLEYRKNFPLNIL